MNNWRIKLLALLAAGVILLAPACRADMLFPVGFWLDGVLKKDANNQPPDLSGFKIYFYKTSTQNNVPSSACAVAVSDANGNFSLNAMGDADLLPLTAGTYYFGVEQKIVNGVPYGISEKLLTLEAADINNGFKVMPDDFAILGANQGLKPTGPILITSPSAGANWQIASTHMISWETSIPINNFKIDYSSNGGATYSNITTVSNVSTCAWTVIPPPTGSAKIKVSDANDPSVSAESETFGVSTIAMREGPTLEITALLEGFLDPVSGKQVSTSIEVEFRTGNDMFTTTTVTIEPFFLIYNNNTKAIDGCGKDVTDGDYYLVIRHLNHLSIILKDKVSISKTTTATVDVSQAATQLEYEPAGATYSAMKVVGAVRLVRGGEYKADGLITVDDWQVWKDNYGLVNPDLSADGNGSGTVTVDDWQIWKDNYGSKSYVP